MTTLLVTGSTGYLGTKLMEKLSPLYDVIGVARTDVRHPVDVLDMVALQDVFDVCRPDVVIHTAAIADQDAEKIRLPNM